MPRVLFIVDTLSPGGTERSILEITRRMRSFEPIVCTLFAGGRLEPCYRSAGIRSVSLGLTTKYSYLAPRALRRRIREMRPDIVHSSLFKAGIAARLSLLSYRRPPALIHSWVNEPISAQDDQPATLQRRCAHSLDAATSSRVEHFVANSRSIARSNSCALRIDAARVSVIYRGRDPSSFVAPSSEDTVRLRRELDLLPSDRVVLNVARLRSWKGQEVLLEALPRVLQQMPEVMLILAGDGPARSSLERRARDLSISHRCRLLGHRDDVRELLATASVFAFPSFREGFPGALIEAMHAARPIVASDIPVHREVLGDDESALVAGVGNSEEWARALLTLLANRALAESLGASAKQRACNVFDAATMATRHEDLYSEVLRRRQAPKQMGVACAFFNS